jgi:tungstate transport system permease protein
VGLIGEGLVQAGTLLAAADPARLGVTGLSLKVSGAATALSLLIGMPLGTVLALARFPGRGFVVALVNTGMGLPPVVVGLFVSIVLWRSGPLGALELLYTPTAIVVAQFVIAVPVVTGLTLAAVQQIPERFRLQVQALGASRLQLLGVLIREARLPLLAALMAGFGAVISEVGASLMVGGNIRGQTRVLTTATVLETGKGNFDVAIALSVILLTLTFLVNWRSPGSSSGVASRPSGPGAPAPRAESLRCRGRPAHCGCRSACPCWPRSWPRSWESRSPTRSPSGASGPAGAGRPRDAAARAAAHGDGLLPDRPPRPARLARGPLYALPAGAAVHLVRSGVAAAVMALPLLVRPARAAIESVNPDLERAAFVLGRSEWRTALEVTLPLARRGIVAGLVLAFARALGEFGATLMLAGNIPGRTTTVPLAIYTAVSTGEAAEARVLVLVLTALSCAVVVLASRLGSRL